MKLSDRVEALTGPDREVDALIWAIADPKEYERRCSFKGMKYAGHVHTKEEKVAHIKRHAAYAAPAYTASLDAAMMLLPVFETEDGPMQADFILECVNGWLTIGCRVGHDNPDEASWAETPAIALTAAALRARGL